ncbi:LytR/AlgR family response regulator transcription factor [Hyalangium rubrum]|uniref:LytTR family DNA-binding domain-containing protein n=1 Tax=Hyalangium rubrum TaxID=3103134 RepID=A0ABU5H970_9BACT|nr:LytTR family DNA-binding domain-containing protein [Hyalangium sp. s54d21]MDY7230033.1 LytTR family DNA-binding domain-containing protein [Hyalangium sp. s54d21]
MSLAPPPPPIRALVVDDERIARESLCALLAADHEVEVVGQCANGSQAVEALRRQSEPVEVVFLDVEMAGKDGFQVLSELGDERTAAVIFVTAYENYALKAFEFRALDYLLKPFDDERFAQVLARAKEHVKGVRVQRAARELAEMLGTSLPAPTPPPAPRYVERLVLKDMGRMAFLPVGEIDWLEAEDNYIQVHAGAQKHLVRQSLREMEEELDPRRFVRIHRSTIVNVERVKELRPLFHGEYQVTLHDGTSLKLSRGYRERLDALLGKG